MRNIVVFCLAVATALSALVMIYCRIANHGAIAWWCTVAASTGFVLLGIVAGYDSWYGRFVACALAFCWTGDMIGSSSFFTSVIAFLTAHLLLIVAFLIRGFSAIRILRTAAVIVLSSGAVLWWLLPHVPARERVLILAYVAVIGAMVSFAGGVGGIKTLAFWAAVIFYISDGFVARWKYVDQSFMNAIGCYSLYYVACILFGLSAWFGNHRQYRYRSCRRLCLDVSSLFVNVVLRRDNSSNPPSMEVLQDP